ncbi:MAG: toll/interleukin-1 receptor domain-containing protein [Halobacteriota archaeon]|nr:toll/interleukin-1 receptor domain-containing protein [Halobacteriota archaeon]
MGDSVRGLNDSIIEEIENGVLKSNVLLLLISKEFPDSKWMRVEYESAITKQIKEGSMRVIAVLLDEGTPEMIPTFLKSKRYIDFRGTESNEEVFINKTLELVDDLQGISKKPALETPFKGK